MADRREPEAREPDKAGPARPSGRAIMANSPLRWAVLVAFIVGGALLLSKGFESTSSAAGTPGSTTQPSGSSSSPSQTPSHTPSHTPSAPSLVGITVAIYNSTTTPGLASDQRQQLDVAGWDVVSIGNVHTQFPTT